MSNLPGWPLAALLGACLLALSVTVLALSWPRRPSVEEWLTERGRRRLHSSRRERGHALERASRAFSHLLWRRLPPALRSRLAGTLDQAGAGDSAELVVSRGLLETAIAALLASGLVEAGLLAPGLALLVVLAVPLLVLARIARRAAARRRAVVDQLPVLVDLMALEQGGGGVGARSAMESVVVRVGGEAAQLLRGCLARSAAAGTPPLDRQLEQAGARLEVPALSALAAVVRIQREEGVSTASPLGQLARGLRDRQRDELVVRGRRALVTMLLPVALCILLPFILIILYPALSRLATAFS